MELALTVLIWVIIGMVIIGGIIFFNLLIAKTNRIDAETTSIQANTNRMYP